MVAELPAPARPLTGGKVWTWQWRDPSTKHPWGWCRIYHRSDLTPDAVTHRRWGPLHRLDPHTPDTADPQVCPDGRSVLYLAGNLATALGEVFGDFPAALVCPRYRVGLLCPDDPIDVLDLRSQAAAMRIGALPSLASGAYPRWRTQQWARAVYEDQPVTRRTLHGIYYGAAHASGPALALWNTGHRVRVVDDGGDVQDLGLADPQIWPRVVVAARSIRVRARRVDHCPQCSS